MKKKLSIIWTLTLFIFIQNLDGSTILDKSGNISLTSDTAEALSDTTTVFKEGTPMGGPVTPAEIAAQGGGDAVEAAIPEPTKTHDSPMKRPNRRSEEGGKDRRPRKVCTRLFDSKTRILCLFYLSSLCYSFVQFQVDLKDKIVSPVIWQPGQKSLHSHGHGYHGHHGHHGHGRNQKFKERKINGPPQKEPKFRAKDATFQFGNFNRFVLITFSRIYFVLSF